jgi:hypothetical protein
MYLPICTYVDGKRKKYYCVCSDLCTKTQYLYNVSVTTEHYPEGSSIFWHPYGDAYDRTFDRDEANA